ALVSDLIDLLLAPGDVTILAARPVSPRTLLMARAGHALLYTALIAGAFALPSWAVGMVVVRTWGWTLLFPVAAGLAALTTLLGVTAIFAVLLRVSHPERVRNIILIAQIVGSLITFGGYYALSGLMRSAEAAPWLKSEHALQLLIPPYWFAALATADVAVP